MRISVRHPLAMFLAFVSAWLVPPSQSPAVEKKLQAWKFDQTSSVDGQYSLIVLDTAIKAVFPSRHFVYLCAAPSWSPVIFNLKSKTQVVFGKADYWGGFHVGDETKTRFGNSAAVSQSWEGKPVQIITSQVLVADPAREQLEMIYRQGSKRADAYKSEQLMVAKWPKMRPETLTFLRNFHRTMNLQNVLMKRVHCYPNGKNDVVLTTTSCRSVELSPSEFRYPEGYRNADMAVVTEEADRRKNAVGVFEDLFEEKGATRKAK